MMIPIEVTLLDIVTDFSDIHDEKAELPNNDNNDDNDDNDENDDSDDRMVVVMIKNYCDKKDDKMTTIVIPIEMTLLGIITVVSVVIPEKADEPSNRDGVSNIADYGSGAGSDGRIVWTR